MITGLFLGHKAPTLQTARSRIAENINWRTVQFLLKNVVFLLIGLQVRGIFKTVGAARLPWSQIVWPCRRSSRRRRRALRVDVAVAGSCD